MQLKEAPSPRKVLTPTTNDMAQITLAVGGMMIAKSIHWYRLDPVEPFKMWRFTSQNSSHVTIQFISVPHPENCFKVELCPDDNNLMYSQDDTNKHLMAEHCGKLFFDEDSSEFTANLETSQIIKKLETLIGNKLYWCEPFTVCLPKACNLNASDLFAYHSMGQNIQEGAPINHVQLMLMVTYHLICVQNNKKPNAVVNRTHGFDKLFEDDSDNDEDKDEEGLGCNSDTINNIVEN